MECMEIVERKESEARKKQRRGRRKAVTEIVSEQKEVRMDGGSLSEKEKKGAVRLRRGDGSGRGGSG